MINRSLYMRHNNKYKFMQLSLACLLMLIMASATAKDWQVTPAKSIAKTIVEARTGDIIRVEHGYYHEQIIIDKPLTLIGINRPTISGDNKPGDVIRIDAPDVRVEGFIIRDSGDNLTNQNAGIYVKPGSHRANIRNNDIAYTLFGLWIEKANDVRVAGNLITGKRDYQSAQRGNGIQLYNTTGAQIIDNNISFTRDGIYVDVSHHALFRGNRMHHLRYGTHYMNSYFNVWEDNDSYLNRGGLALMEVREITVINNRAWGNSDHGIMLRTIQDSTIESNIVAGNGRGFFVYDAEYNTLKNNLIIDNRVGIHLWAGSKNNRVDGNDIINNQNQIKYVAANDVLWGNQQGNYWSNYLGWDQNGDGIGDTRYEANDIVDHLTWKYPMTRILLNSPAVHSLRLVSQQFPLLRAPSIIDHKPRMRPYHDDWSSWLDKKRH